jgi:hypothetical protein
MAGKRIKSGRIVQTFKACPNEETGLSSEILIAMAALISLSTTTPPKKKAQSERIRLIFFLTVLFASLIIIVALPHSHEWAPVLIEEND